VGEEKRGKQVRGEGAGSDFFAGGICQTKKGKEKTRQTGPKTIRKAGKRITGIVRGAGCKKECLKNLREKGEEEDGAAKWPLIKTGEVDTVRCNISSQSLAENQEKEKGKLAAVK